MVLDLGMQVWPSLNSWISVSAEAEVKMERFQNKDKNKKELKG